MANSFQRLKDLLREQGFKIEGHLKTDWQASSENSRKLIRSDIVTTLPNLSEQEKENILDLKKRPRSQYWHISISHTTNVGGWLAVPSTTQLGFDVELSERVRERVIERIARPEEINLCPEPKLLWPAMEAAFKALLNEHQPTTITKLITANWVKLNEDAFQFDCPTIGRGYVCLSDTHFFSAFITNQPVSN